MVADKFESPEHIGPKSVANFEEIVNPEERLAIQRNAYERVHDFLDRIGIR